MIDPEENARVFAFLEQLMRDRERGETQSVEKYIALFPGIEHQVRREFEQMESGCESTRLDSATRSGEPQAWARIVDALRRSHDEDRYEDEEEIARGGMGSIRRVFDKDLRRHLAKKVLRHGVQDVQILSRFLEEAQVTSQLEHPGIVPVHELGTDARGQVFFTMSLVRGRNLAEIFRQARARADEWPLTKVLGVLIRVCEAVAFAHSRDVVHRDLKPANIMVGSFGETYVMDWGLARVMHEPDKKDIRIQSLRQELGADELASPLLTMDGAVLGTPAYMSPEQARGDVDDVGPRSDNYSLGAMLYHLLAGHAPYLPPSENISSRVVLAQILEGPPAALDSADLRIPAELVAICAKAMARDPGDRYATAKDLAEDMQAFLDTRVVAAYEAGTFAELRKWVRRNKALATTALGLVLALAVGLVVSFVFYWDASANAAEARRNLRQLADLSTIRRVETLVDRTETLWPIHPDRIPALAEWIREASALRSDLEKLRPQLQVLHEEALPLNDAERAADRARHPRAGDLATAESELALLEKRKEEIAKNPLPRAEANRTKLQETITRQKAQVAGLEAAVQERLTYRFRDGAVLSAEDKAWRQRLLYDLVKNLEEFLEDSVAPDGVTGVYEPTLAAVKRRLELAADLLRRREAEEIAQLWLKVKEDVAREESPYKSLKLEPIADLVPLDKNPRTGLWEFWHVVSGDRPEPNSEWYWSGEDPSFDERVDEPNRWKIEDETGLVFVLVPGGDYLVGAQRVDPEKPHFHKDARSNESPVHEVPLDAFLISKYEMTQGQWRRFTGTSPSNFPAVSGRRAPAGIITLSHPVEQISWEDCRLILPRLGLDLPTEAQWEAACRAGSTWPWWSGRDPERLAHVGNVADLFAHEHDASRWQYEKWNDGRTLPAPVGSYRANRFGFHDVHGNVGEWCRDKLGAYNESVPREGDGLRELSGDRGCVFRGGGFNFLAVAVRSAYRSWEPPNARTAVIGVRPLLHLGVHR